MNISSMHAFWLAAAVQFSHQNKEVGSMFAQTALATATTEEQRRDAQTAVNFHSNYSQGLDALRHKRYDDSEKFLCEALSAEALSAHNRALGLAALLTLWRASGGHHSAPYTQTVQKLSETIAASGEDRSQFFQSLRQTPSLYPHTRVVEEHVCELLPTC